jgi:hypothetical protein
MSQNDIGRTPWTRALGPAAVAACLLLMPAVSAQAASMRPLELEELVDLADEIVVGRVGDSEARFEGKLIVTVTAIQVEEALKGNGPGRIEITQLGGTAVHPRTGIAVNMTASHHVALGAGQDVLLFVSRSRSGIRQIVGAAQGRFVIQIDPTTGVRRVPVGPKRLGRTVTEGVETVAPEAISLDDLKARIHARVKAAPKRGGER